MEYCKSSQRFHIEMFWTCPCPEVKDAKVGSARQEVPRRRFMAVVKLLVVVREKDVKDSG